MSTIRNFFRDGGGFLVAAGFFGLAAITQLVALLVALFGMIV